jgi:cyclophilin family peptidyl-prolyl cis-trans isomerase
MYQKLIIPIVAIIIIALSWFFLDHRSGYPKSVEDLTAPAHATTTSATSTTPTSSTDINKTPATAGDQNPKTMHTVTIETNKGTIVFETYDTDAPKTAENFISLANKGFYNGLIFHRVIQGFMIQGGDPTGTGMGGPGYKFADELNSNTLSSKAGYVRGVVAMANSGPNTNGSQFFIMHKDTPLPHSYTIFGKVISGMDVVDAIAQVSVDSPTHNKPLTDVVMTKVTVAGVK